jgi:hypothetical protein
MWPKIAYVVPTIEQWCAGPPLENVMGLDCAIR